MAETGGSIFNNRAVERLRSPDDLEKYVRITSPSVWVFLGACIALLAGLLVWGIFGSVSTSVSSTGVVVDGQAMCFLDAGDVAKVHEGDIVNIGGELMEVKSVAPIPASRDEANQILSNDYLVHALLQGDWAYQVIFEGDSSNLPSSVPLTVNITVERVAPISLILGRQ